MRLVVGLDIGITSVGYGVIDIDSNECIDCGVRLFSEGTAENNVERRTSRGTRRLKRRKKNRIEDMSKLLENSGIKTKDYRPSNNPYQIREKGLHQKLTNQELTSAILHITKHRGSSLDVEEDDDGTVKEILQKNKKLLDEGKFVCQIQLERLKNDGQIRGINNHFKTNDYICEMKEILLHQSLNEELIDQILNIIRRKRNYYEGPGSEKSPTPYGRWVDFNVEPIDLIEKMRGHCSVYSEQFRAPKHSYAAELFNLLNDLNNLTINNEKLTKDEKLMIIEEVNNTASMTPKRLAKLLDVNLDQIKGFRIDKNDKPLLTEFKGYKEIKKILDKYNYKDYVNNKEIIDDIAEILTKIKGINEKIEKIRAIYSNMSDELLFEIATLKNITQYHSLSFKALRELNEEMLNSEMNQMQLLHQLELYNKNRVSMKGKKNIVANDTAILSPVVKRSQREALKIINELRKKYGEFDSIVIETTRDKNTNEQKKRIKESQKYYENKKKEVDALLQSKGYNVSRINDKTKLKVRLYLEQNAQTAYTLEPIDLNLLITNPNAYEIEHIIPYSISLDDSFNNKVLASYNENQIKSKKTPIYSFLNGDFKELGGSLEKYKANVKLNKNYSKKKKDYLLYEKDITKYSNMKEFIARNLVDTSYATRVVMNTLQMYFKDNNIDTKVHTVKGSATSLFRKYSNLPKEREKDYLHHAIDALIVASIKKLHIFDYYLTQSYDEETGEVIQVDYDDIMTLKIKEFINSIRVIYEESYQYYNGLIPYNQLRYPLIKISHKIDTKPNRKFADKTIYSTRVTDGIEKRVAKYKDIYDVKFSTLTNDIIQGNVDKYLMYYHDKQTFNIIENIILDHFHTYKDDRNIYSKEVKKGKEIYSLKGANNPLYLYAQENGKIRKYSKKNNGPEIKALKYYDGKLGSHIDVSKKYSVHNKKVVLLQVKPYRTDFYVSPNGKYKMITIKYNQVYYKKSIDKYVIDKTWYDLEKVKYGIDETYRFVCSLHHNELIGIQKEKNKKYVYDLSTELGGKTRFYNDDDVEILRFTATNNQSKGVIEVKPIYTYCQKRLMPSLGTFIKVEKYATDVLGNLYKVDNNVLKLEFK